MELDELHVAHLGAGAQAEGQPVTGGDGVVAGRLVHLTGAAGGQQDGRCADDAEHAGVIEHEQPGHRTRRDAHDVDGGVPLEDRPGLDAGQEGTLDLGARGVTSGVDDAERGVAALAGQRQRPVGSGSNVAPYRWSVVNPAKPSPRIAVTAAGSQRPAPATIVSRMWRSNESPSS